MELEESDLFSQDPELAANLWAQGFRPQQACTLQPVQTVAYKTTMFGLADGQPWKIADVLSVVTEDGTTTVDHTGGQTEADECSEVWAK
jgi:hypothetical protein